MIDLLLAISLQSAMTPDQARAYARVDQAGQYAVSSAWCPRLGYTLTEGFPDQLQDRVAAEAASAGVERSLADRWASEAVGRHLALGRAELDRVVDQAGQGGEREIIGSLFDEAAERCERFAADPISVGLIAGGSPEERAEAKREAMDALLEELGQASWQTPQMVARAEVLYAVGACKPALPPSRHDELVAEFMPASGEDGREERYLAGQYIEGLRSSAQLDFDMTQCERVLRGRLPAAR